MYHYVRNIKGSNYPGINGLEYNSFKKQLDFLTNNYNIITTYQLFDTINSGAELPPKPCLLTFDDGYKDHVNFVLPELLSRNLHGAFFPVAETIEKKCLRC